MDGMIFIHRREDWNGNPTSDHIILANKHIQLTSQQSGNCVEPSKIRSLAVTQLHIGPLPEVTCSEISYSWEWRSGSWVWGLGFRFLG